MSAECAWLDTGSTKSTKVLCKCVVQAIPLGRCCVCVQFLLHPYHFPVSREESEAPPSESSQKSILTLSFPRFPMLSRPSLPSNKG